MLTALLGCSSAYQLSPKAAQLRATLDDDGAHTIVERAMVNENGKGGLYLVGPTKSRPVAPTLNGSKLSFSTAGFDQVSGVKVTGTTAQVTETEHTTLLVAIDLQKISKIKVKKTPGDSGFLRPGYLVWFFETGRLDFLIFNPSEDELDSLLAAATHYSPKAPIYFGGAF
jgi:hypothetical protein